MATSSFYSDNMFRSYPFVADQTTPLPVNRLAGIKMCFLYGAKISAFPVVKLDSWYVSYNGSHTLTFSCIAPNNTITKYVTIPPNTPPLTRVVSDDADDIYITLITGRLIGETESFSELDLRVEPTCIVWLQHRGISRIRIGNQARYKLDQDSEGKDLIYDPDSEWWNQPVEGAGEIQDKPLLFSDGWNCNASLSQIDTKISLNAVESGGLGEVSEDLPRGYILGKFNEPLEEQVPSPQLRYDGLPNYKLITYSFCGATGPDVAVLTTDTVLVRADQSVFTLYVSVANLGGDSC
jgi:hypothetical protein